MSNEQETRRARELEWNTALLAGSPDFDSYRALRSKRRTHATHNTALAVWTLHGGEAQILNRYFVRNIMSTMAIGFKLTLIDEMTKGLIEVGHLPVRLPGTDCFVWISRHSDARFVPYDWEQPTGPQRFSLGVMLGSAGNLEDPAEDVEYLTLYRDIEKFAPRVGASAHA